RAELPLLRRVLEARLEPALLLLVGDRQPVLDDDDPGAQEVALELRARPHEVLVLVLRAEAHDVLDAGAVVPGAVEQDHLARRRQVRDVALEVPLRALALRRRAEGDDAHDPRVRLRRDALDRAALAGRVAALEEHRDLEAGVDDPLLQAHELRLQALELLLVLALAEGARLGRAAVVHRRPLPGALDGGHGATLLPFVDFGTPIGRRPRADGMADLPRVAERVADAAEAPPVLLVQRRELRRAELDGAREQGAGVVDDQREADRAALKRLRAEVAL